MCGRLCGLGIGHIAVGIGLKGADRRINAGILVFAALFADFLLGVFVLLGLEDYFVPPNFSTLHYLQFEFPYSHGLAASIGWAGAAALAALLFWPKGDSRRARIALIVAAVVFSHFLLDALAHTPELPVWGPDSRKLGLGLSNHLRIEAGLELLMTAVALGIYLRSAGNAGRLGRYGMVALVTLLSVLTVGGQALAGSVPSRAALISDWIAFPAVVAAAVLWLDRKRAAA